MDFLPARSIPRSPSSSHVRFVVVVVVVFSLSLSLSQTRSIRAFQYAVHTILIKSFKKSWAFLRFFTPCSHRLYACLPVCVVGKRSGLEAARCADNRRAVCRTGDWRNRCDERDQCYHERPAVATSSRSLRVSRTNNTKKNHACKHASVLLCLLANMCG